MEKNIAKIREQFRLDKVNLFCDESTEYDSGEIEADLINSDEIVVGRLTCKLDNSYTITIYESEAFTALLAVVKGLNASDGYHTGSYHNYPLTFITSSE